MSCKIVINDEVNIKIEGLPVDVRRKIANNLNMKDFRDKGHKIATAMNILKRKHGYLK